MGEMRERLKEAICEASAGEVDQDRTLDAIVKAVVTILRNPTPAMLHVALSGPKSVLSGQPILLEAWQNMLAEAGE
jgi:hypothetical protein